MPTGKWTYTHRLSQTPLHTQIPHTCVYTDILRLHARVGAGITFPSLRLRSAVCFKLSVNFPVLFQGLCIFLSHSHHLDFGEAEVWVGRGNCFESTSEELEILISHMNEPKRQSLSQSILRDCSPGQQCDWRDPELEPPKTARGLLVMDS